MSFLFKTRNFDLPVQNLVTGVQLKFYKLPYRMSRIIHTLTPLGQTFDKAGEPFHDKA